MTATLPVEAGHDSQATPQGFSVSVVVPTRHEAENVEPLSRRLAAAMTRADLTWEVIFVDDSDDETPSVVERLARDGLPLRLIHRAPGDRQGGLGGAVVAGFALAQGEVVVVIDADLQHPPELAAPLSRLVSDGLCDLAVASRYAPGGGDAGLAGPGRRLVSHAAPLLVRMALPRLHGVRDPLSGYFAVRRRLVETARLEPEGFKILLEVLARAKWKSLVEVPFTFGERCHGESKAGFVEGLRFARQVTRLALSAKP